MSWTVSALVRAVSDALKARFAVLNVRGEISSFTRAASGHCYFTLKDETSQIRCAMFQRAAGMLSFNPANGDEVELQGRLALYEQRGELQLIVEVMRPVGQGRLLEQFQQLKTKLGNEGLFDTARKRAVPRYPQVLGVVSSLQAAALHDVLTALRRRASHVRVVIYPASVQGTQAAAELVSAIHKANQRHEADTLLVCRGGGSLEDLWSFNEEAVVRAVAASSIPVISGVGHETDFTLTDFAADLRAPTPTAAAELAAPMRADLLKTVFQHAQDMQRQVRVYLDQLGQRIDHAALSLKQPAVLLHTQKNRLEQAALRCQQALRQQLTSSSQQVLEQERLLPLYAKQVLQQNQSRLDQLSMRWQQQEPVRLMRNAHQRLEQLAWRGRDALQQQLQSKQHQMQAQASRLSASALQGLDARQQRLQHLSVRLNAMNPSQVLSRGYAWISDANGRVYNSVTQLQPGQQIQAQFADGKAAAEVKQVMPDLIQHADDDSTV